MRTRFPMACLALLMAAMLVLFGCNSGEKPSDGSNDNAETGSTDGGDADTDAAKADNDNSADSEANVDDENGAVPFELPTGLGEQGTPPDAPEPPKPMSPVDTSTLGPKNNLNTAYLPSDAGVAMVLHPARVAQAPGIGVEVGELLKRALGRELGDMIPPTNIARLVYASQLNAVGAAETSIVIEFTAPTDGAAFFRQFISQDDTLTVAEKELEGVKYLTAEMPPQLPIPNMPPQVVFSSFAPNENTLVVVPGELDSRMLKGEPATGHMADRLAHADLNKDAIILVSLESDAAMGRQMSDEMNAAMANPMNPIGQQMQAVKPIIDQLPNIRALSISADLSSDPMLQATVYATKDDVAGQLSDALNVLIGTGKVLLPTYMEAVQGDPNMAEMKPLLDVASLAIESLTVVQEGAQAKATLNKPAGFDAAIKPVLADAITQMDKDAARSVVFERMFTVLEALAKYNDENDAFPAPAIRDEAGNAMLSWRVAILPQLGQEELYNQFHLNEPWDSEHNKTLIAKMPENFLTDGDQPGMTRFLAFTGENTVLETPDVHPMMMMSKLAVVQVGPDKAVPWTSPQDVVYTSENLIASLGQLDEDGAIAMMFDGRPNLIPLDAEADLLESAIILTEQEKNFTPQQMGMPGMMGMPPGMMTMPPGGMPPGGMPPGGMPPAGGAMSPGGMPPGAIMIGPDGQPIAMPPATTPAPGAMPPTEVPPVTIEGPVNVPNDPFNDAAPAPMVPPSTTP